jgi:hypothetical protein
MLLLIRLGTTGTNPVGKGRPPKVKASAKRPIVTASAKRPTVTAR